MSSDGQHITRPHDDGLGVRNAAHQALQNGLRPIVTTAGFLNYADLSREYARILDKCGALVRGFLIQTAVGEGVAVSGSSTNAELSDVLIPPHSTKDRAQLWVNRLANTIVICEWPALVQVLEGSPDPAMVATRLVLANPAVCAVPPTYPMRTVLGEKIKELITCFMALTTHHA